MLQSVLVTFLHEFFNVSDGKEDTEKAIKLYINQNLVEKVNYGMCSEIWNDYLMLPNIVKEDPNLFANSVFASLIRETVAEALLESKPDVPTVLRSELVTMGYEHEQRDHESQF